MSETSNPKPDVLICDDELGVRESLRLILEGQCVLSFAVNGEEAVRHVKAHSPALQGNRILTV